MIVYWLTWSVPTGGHSTTKTRSRGHIIFNPGNKNEDWRERRRGGGCQHGTQTQTEHRRLKITEKKLPHHYNLVREFQSIIVGVALQALHIQSHNIIHHRTC